MASAPMIASPKRKTGGIWTQTAWAPTFAGIPNGGLYREISANPPASPYKAPTPAAPAPSPYFQPPAPAPSPYPPTTANDSQAADILKSGYGDIMELLGTRQGEQKELADKRSALIESTFADRIPEIEEAWRQESAKSGQRMVDMGINTTIPVGASAQIQRSKQAAITAAASEHAKAQAADLTTRIAEGDKYALAAVQATTDFTGKLADSANKLLDLNQQRQQLAEQVRAAQAGEALNIHRLNEDIRKFGLTEARLKDEFQKNLAESIASRQQQAEQAALQRAADAVRLAFETRKFNFEVSVENRDYKRELEAALGMSPGSIKGGKKGGGGTKSGGGGAVSFFSTKSGQMPDMESYLKDVGVM